jgi:glycosyltransferase involved in cell wall biosynthesis
MDSTVTMRITNKISRTQAVRPKLSRLKDSLKKAVRQLNAQSSFRVGYGEGRSAGYSKGIEQGRSDGYMEMRKLLGASHVLVITPSLELPSLEIMIHQPFRTLVNQGFIRYTVKTENNVQRQDIEYSQWIVFLRNVEPIALDWMKLAHELGKRTVYCIDDNFLEIPENTEVTSYYRDPVFRETFIQLMTHAGVVKVDSTYFAEYIRLHFNPRIACFPSSVDFDWISMAEKPVRSDGFIVIGYEGTNKEKDFSPVIPALLRVLNEYGGLVRLQFHGWMPEALSRHPWVTHHPISMNYRSYIQSLKQSTWDIGIAPLGDSLFNYCKTNNKFREYAACGIPGIYSDTPAYRDCVLHRETGLLIPHTVEGWYEGLREMIDSKELRHKMNVQAGAVVRQLYTIPLAAERWLKDVLRA